MNWVHLQEFKPSPERLKKPRNDISSSRQDKIWPLYNTILPKATPIAVCDFQFEDTGLCEANLW